MSRTEAYKRNHGLLSERERVGTVMSTDVAVEASPRAGPRVPISRADSHYSSEPEQCCCDLKLDR